MFNNARLLEILLCRNVRVYPMYNAHESIHIHILLSKRQELFGLIGTRLSDKIN